jgi:hypothetical protein
MRIVRLVRAIRALRRPPDLSALRSAPDPASFARAALVPAARNLGVAICLLPPAMCDEATVAFLACRVLDAFEDLGGAPAERRSRLLLAVDYLCDRRGRAPEGPPPVAVRDTDRVDAVLADRIGEVRALLRALPPDRRAAVHALLTGIGGVMARNLESPLAREAYGRGVLGEVVGYASELVAQGRPAVADFCASVGVLVQLANDLRDGEGAHYGATTQAELVRQVILRLPPLVVAAFALLADLGRAMRSRGARMATAYLTMTTAGFLCRQVGAAPPYHRLAILPAALRAGTGRRGFAAVLGRVGHAVNGAVAPVIAPWAPGRAGADSLTLIDVVAVRRAVTAAAPVPPTNPLMAAAFRFITELPTDRLTGELDAVQVLRLMLADQLAFEAFDEIGPDRTGRMRELADVIQQAATAGARP